MRGSRIRTIAVGVHSWFGITALRSAIPIRPASTACTSSGGTWALELRTFSAGRPESITVLDSGSVRSLDLAADGSNVVRVMAIETVGYFFVNDNYVATLDLSGRGRATGVTLGAGDVAVVSGFLDVDRVNGATTNYSALNVAQLSYSGETSATPTPHSLILRSSGDLDSDPANINAKNVIVFASFNNPGPANGLTSGAWDFGFVFRKARLAESYRLVITADDEKWWLRRVHHDGVVVGDPTPTANDYRAVDDGTLSDLDTDEDSYNDLLLIAIGSVGHFFLNNTYIASLDLSDNQLDGDVEAGTGFFSSSSTGARTMTYDSFRVWWAK
jgi:hypothetical protein